MENLVPPICWSADKWDEKMAQYPWLKLKVGGGLLCQVCIDVKRVTPNTSKNSRIRKEWVETGVFCNGNTKNQQLTSLRKKISEHVKSEAHQDAAKCSASAKADPLPNMLAIKHKTNYQSTENVFRCAYLLAKLNRPYSDMFFFR